jgi:hypothetical protein
MSRFLLVGPFLALSACKNDTELGAIDPELEISPQLLDFQNVAVGSAVELTFQLDHTGGLDADVRNIAVTNIDGTFFSYGGETSFAVPKDSSQEIAITYAPAAEGWHRATVEIVHTGEGGRFVVDVRGHAVVPALSVSPLGLDFGPVPTGTPVALEVTVTNDAGVPVQITDAVIGNGVFALDAVFPLDVPTTGSLPLSVVFTPETSLPVISTLVLEVGAVALPTVTLRGNDCENGIPSAYDADHDGFTTCAGDCVDDDASINPGAVEVHDGIDQDCDGAIDDGTPGADDDGDGFCDDPTVCTDGSLPGDCADGDAAVSPGAVEDLLNGIDDDCDGVVDLGTSDLDGDGYAPAGGDCDDQNALRAPGFAEVADGVDNDCDTVVDEGTSAYDDDGDGFCELACTDGSAAGDCDDARTDIFPGATEIGDFRDQDCDGTVDEGTDRADDDSDGFTEVGGDCDDADAAINPAMGNC